MGHHAFLKFTSGWTLSANTIGRSQLRAADANFTQCEHARRPLDAQQDDGRRGTALLHSLIGARVLAVPNPGGVTGY